MSARSIAPLPAAMGRTEARVGWKQGASAPAPARPATGGHGGLGCGLRAWHQCTTCLCAGYAAAVPRKLLPQLYDFAAVFLITPPIPTQPLSLVLAQAPPSSSRLAAATMTKFVIAVDDSPVSKNTLQVGGGCAWVCVFPGLVFCQG